MCLQLNSNLQFFVRAMFDYDPANDNLLPCQDIGLSFCRGDILEVGNNETKKNFFVPEHVVIVFICSNAFSSASLSWYFLVSIYFLTKSTYDLRGGGWSGMCSEARKPRCLSNVFIRVSHWAISWASRKYCSLVSVTLSGSGCASPRISSLTAKLSYYTYYLPYSPFILSSYLCPSV